MERHDSRSEQFTILGYISYGLGDLDPALDSYLRTGMGRMGTHIRVGMVDD